MNKYVLDTEKYAAIARRAAAEGIVLLRNEKNALPFQKGLTVSLFGRIQFNYYKSGTGSGGMVNTRYATGILDAFKACELVRLNEDLLHTYEDWVKDHPFDKGVGWAGEPWCQEEMPLSDETARHAAKASDAAVVVIGRASGEDKDNSAQPGSYLLTDLETQMLETVCRHFERVAVVLNVGNIIDMKWVEQYKPAAVLYAWQEGQEGGSALLDVLTGAVTPSGRLTDTIACDISDYPSAKNFGDEKRNDYIEDIYVGYRYFETVAKDKVLYPFGFGLSYTTFETAVTECARVGETVTVRAQVRNTGACAGQEVVQVYASAPQGALGKPARVLIGFMKTKDLAPGASEELTLTVPLAELASYDDSGATGHKSCYVLEAGEYEIFVGANVRAAAPAGRFTLAETVVTARLTEALSPVNAFERMKPVWQDGGYRMQTEPVPLRTYRLPERAAQGRAETRPCTGDQGYKLADVVNGKVSLEAFLDQISEKDLCCLVRGEGMSSPKVTPGTGGAFGGVTDSLLGYGIPLGCCTDGPSGLRMDCGAYAFSLPNGTALGCTFNVDLVTALFDMTGCEMRKNRIDLLLGPGMNIHRHPLNGRNFEYFSEDPLLTGKMAAAQLKGMHKWEVSGTIKHFAANNQEFKRFEIDSVASERALREIYLKGYEIAVKEGGAFTIMSTYGAINGLWTAGHYDLLTTVLRGEWGFEGIVMTDWWAKINDEGEEAVRTNLSAMIRAQNDLYMVVQDSLTHSDNLAEGLKSGAVTRGDLLRVAGNICKVLMRLAVMKRHMDQLDPDETAAAEQAAQEDGDMFAVLYVKAGAGLDGVLDTSTLDTSAGASTVFHLTFTEAGMYEMTVEYRINANELAQVPMSLLMNNLPIQTLVLNGTNNEWKTLQNDFPAPHAFGQFFKLFFAQGGMEIRSFTFKRKDA